MFHTLLIQQNSFVRGEFGTPPPKRRKTKSETQRSQQYKDSGVKKTFCVGIVKDVPETHSNCKRLLKNVCLKKFGFMLGDLKIVRMCYGMQPCSAKFSCPWCHATAPYDQKTYKLRTFKSLRDNYNGFKDLVEKNGLKEALKLAKNFKSVTKENLMEGEDWEEVVERSPPGECHVNLGVINKTFDSLEAAVIEDNNGDNLNASVYDWARLPEQSLVGLGYRGGKVSLLGVVAL